MSRPFMESIPSLLVVIDGPAGAGKTTVSRALARRLGLPLLDTGAIYRALALVADERGVSWDDGPALSLLCANLDLEFGALGENGPQPVRLAGRDVTRTIREPRISDGASRVSRHPEVRAALLPVQRMLARSGCVAEGRDMGTVVFPEARFKFFLTADLRTRALRRHEELSLNEVEPPVFDDVERTIGERDSRDRGREIAPLAQSADAFAIDTSSMEVDAVIDRILGVMRVAGVELPPPDRPG